MNRQRTLRLAAAIGCVLAAAGLAIAPGATPTVSAAAPLVPPTAVYALEGPDTPLPLTYTTANAAASLVVTADGFVSSVSCPAGFSATVSEGVGVIHADASASIAASTSVPCTVSVQLGEGAPPSVTVAVSERDAFNTELAARTQVVTLEEIAVTTTLGDVVLTGGAYREAEPRSVGDELTRSVTFTVPTARQMSFVAPSGSAMTGCAAQLASTATCTVTRTLSLDDLAAGSAAFAPTLMVDGFPVARPADIVVPSERRIGVTASASAGTVRVGESVTIEAVVTNLGSIDLTGLVVAGAGISGVTCNGSDPASLTLAHGGSVRCTATHLATAADVGAVTPVIVRAVAPFGADSDLIDDDATSVNDIDSSSGVAPYSVVDAEISAALSLGSAVAFVDDPGTDSLPLTLTVSSAGALAGAVVTLPAAPFDGVAISGCDSVVAGDCSVWLGSIAAGEPVTRSLDVVVDGVSLPPGGIDGEQIVGTLRASGGIEVASAAAVVRTAGVSAAIADAVVEVSGEHAESTVEISVAAGHPVAITLTPDATRPVTVTGCVDDVGAAHAVVPSAAGAMLGMLPGGTRLTCTLEQEVTATDRTNATMPVHLAVLLSAGSAELTRPLHAELETISLVIAPADAPAPPVRGYSVEGVDPRPNTVNYSFELVGFGDLSRGGTLPTVPSFGTPADTYTCSEGAPGRWSCVGNHTITAADLAATTYRAVIRASVGGSAEVSAAIVIATLHEAIDVLVTELSSPAGSNGYRSGDPIRLLVQVRNVGSLPIVFEGITSNLPVQAAQVSSSLTQAVDGCGGGQSIAPGSTADCDLTVSLPAGFAGSMVTIGVQTAQLGVSSFSVSLAIDPTAPTAPVPTLPSTGSNTGALLACSLASILIGVFLVRRGSARPQANYD